MCNLNLWVVLMLLPHAKISTFHTNLNSYYHNVDIELLLFYYGHHIDE